MSIKILLADDHRIMRNGLRALIEKESGMAVVAEAESGREAVKLALKLEPDVVVMDINMPDLNGIDASRRILAEVPDVKVIAFSMHTDHRFVAEALKAGVSGYLDKNSAFEELARAIRTVNGNQSYLCSRITGNVVKSYVDRMLQEEEGRSGALTDREREIVQLYAEGHSTNQIAGSLNISVKTVETHRRNIMEKLGIGSIAELTKFAIREGLTSLDG